ncbi:CO dehydrogenase maturation factor [Dehalogenimonas formicexedens]|uniref:CO dehydrogenase maturation factor n=1 Tax=Dehalogenimonas formicexedens TaxID=1839801 RepID=A0A1P8F7B3_9CHLR|nr:AAA family ATPase [Dehalogenimonas formicexedens]APV44226.1 CO dehydrogenase maturation factor [Dehalogenimonas formicexedens]APV44252.1 CO dehydrogenase maturation factor [Dehalogenimonas formicexedens]
MTISIAMAGKGGTGKTSIACLIVRYLIKQRRVPVLAVDADPAANLDLGLGVNVEKTIGSILAGYNENKLVIPPGMSKEALLDLKLNESIFESQDFDLITMGRGEGAGCYCFPNNVLKSFIDKLLPNYKFMVMDNEAGLEHLSRGTTESIDHLLLVSNHSVKGVRTVGTIIQLVKELRLNIKHRWVILNQAPETIDPLVEAEFGRLGISIGAAIPEDRLIMEYDWHQRSLLDMPGDSASVQAIDKMMNQILSKNPSEVNS